MKILTKLRMESLLRLLIPIIILVVGGIFFVGVSQVFEKAPVVQNLYEVPADELEGATVTFDVPFIYGCFAYEEQTKNGKGTGIITSKQYLIDANETQYMVLWLNSEDTDMADALLAECDAYLEDPSNPITKTFTVTGKIRRLSTDSLELYYEAVGYHQMDAQEQAQFLPLSVSIDDPWSPDYAFLVMGSIMFLIGTALLICSLAGVYQKRFIKQVEALTNGNTEQLYEFIDAMRKTTSAVGGLYINEGYIFGRSGASHFIYGQKDLVWAYQKNTTQKLYGVLPAGTSSGLVLGTADGAMQTISMRDGSEVQYMLSKIYDQFPSCAQGYSRELESLYSHSPEALRRVGELQHAQVQE